MGFGNSCMSKKGYGIPIRRGRDGLLELFAVHIIT